LDKLNDTLKYRSNAITRDEDKTSLWNRFLTWLEQTLYYPIAYRINWLLDFPYGELYLEGDNTKTADSVTLTSASSTDSGDIDDTKTINQTYYQVLEALGAGGSWTVDFDFTLANNPGRVVLVGRYDAATGAHNIFAEAWNYNTTTWDRFTSASTDFPNTNSTDVEYIFDYDDLSGSLSDYISSGASRVRVDHPSNGIATHDFYIDYIAILERGFTVTAGGTFQVVESLTNGLSNNVTLDSSSGTMTIEKDGIYKVSMSTSFAGTDNATFEGHIFVNNVKQDNIGAKRRLGSDGDVGSTSMTGLLSLEADDVVDLRVTSDTTGDYASIENINWNISRIACIP
jgi:hypothetical protein